MEEKYLNIKTSDLNMNVPQKYYLNEENTKLIYSNLNNKDVIALSDMLTSYVVDVKKQKIFNKKIMSLISVNDQDVGWVHLKQSPRVYRLPTIHGKFKKVDDAQSNNKLDSLKNRLVKVYYIFFIENEPYLLIDKVGSHEYSSIKLKNFHRLYNSDEYQTVDIEENTLIYKDSEFMRIEKSLEETTTCQVSGYFTDLDEVRIKLNGRHYWTRLIHDFSADHSEGIEALDYELVDMLVYLKESDEKLKTKLKNQTYRLKNIENNIQVSNDLQQLYLRKYVGDIYESQ
ncbi:hypothetical protein [Salinicoccus albus]|uniref:hypothetical protein n=1 Tax=Salinicoccus albus TaxID=418756 RepID=UPI00036341CC|nr:hypothetical protein [Salinicoccus albus]